MLSRDRWTERSNCKRSGRRGRKGEPAVRDISGTLFEFRRQQSKQKPRLAGALGADEGARTLDLLHGKRNQPLVVTGQQRTSPANASNRRAQALSPLVVVCLLPFPESFHPQLGALPDGGDGQDRPGHRRIAGGSPSACSFSWRSCSSSGFLFFTSWAIERIATALPEGFPAPFSGPLLLHAHQRPRLAKAELRLPDFALRAIRPALSLHKSAGRPDR
jgi:hypothetical protein